MVNYSGHALEKMVKIWSKNGKQLKWQKAEPFCSYSKKEKLDPYFGKCATVNCVGWY